MKKFIHLRGPMAVGKTSAARQFIAQGVFQLSQIKVFGKYYPYLYDSTRKIVVTGRYDTRECGGLDGIIKNKAVMIEYLTKIVKEVNPDFVVFEAVMYGMTVQFAEQITSWLSKYGYQYVGLCFCPPLEVAIQRVFERNGGKNINLEAFVERYEKSKRSYFTLKEKKYNVRLVDTSKYSKPDMWRIVQEEIE